MTVTQQEEEGKRLPPSRDIWRRTLVLALGGGFGFWATNFAISLTPMAAEYRAGLSIAYVPMLVEALVGGLTVGLGVGFCLLRFFDKIPTKNPILKSLILSSLALILVTIVLEVPGKFLADITDPWHYFLVGALFNVLRISALGIVIGVLFERLHRHIAGT